MKRRLFLENFVLSSVGILLTDFTFSATPLKTESHKKLVILHTNDTHSNIDPFPENHSKYPGMGGIAKRFTVIEKIRKICYLKVAHLSFSATPFSFVRVLTLFLVRGWT